MYFYFVLISIIRIPVEITSSVIIVRIRKYKSIMKKKSKKYDKIEFLAKTKLNSIEVLISKGLIDSYMIHDEFASINHAIKEYNEFKEKIQNPDKK